MGHVSVEQPPKAIASELPPELDDETGKEVEPAEPMLPRVLEALDQAVNRLLNRLAESPARFIQERPASLAEHLAQAQRGEWTGDVGGPRRGVRMVWAVCAAIPAQMLFYLGIWAVAYPTRLFTVVAVVLSTTTLLHQLPLLHWLLPDVLNVAAWFGADGPTEVPVESPPVETYFPDPGGGVG